MQIYYLPNNKEGPLQLQIASVLLQDQNGGYRQATMELNYEQYYRAYLTTSEQGEISLQYSSSTGNLGLAFENVGDDSVVLDIGGRYRSIKISFFDDRSIGDLWDNQPVFCQRLL